LRWYLRGRRGRWSRFGGEKLRGGLTRGLRGSRHGDDSRWVESVDIRGERWRWWTGLRAGASVQELTAKTPTVGLCGLCGHATSIVSWRIICRWPGRPMVILVNRSVKLGYIPFTLNDGFNALSKISQWYGLIPRPPVPRNNCSARKTCAHSGEWLGFRAIETRHCKAERESAYPDGII